ncbi:hypothetical protein D3C72_2302640 [compost metagenome]
MLRRGITSALGTLAAMVSASLRSASLPQGTSTRSPRAEIALPTLIQSATGHFFSSLEVAWNSIAYGPLAAGAGVSAGISRP